jgi:predicted transcriptional regulator
MPQLIMPTQEQSLWTEELGVAIEDVRRELQRVNQEHEAVLEEQKEALLRCQHEIQSLRELTIELQQSI